MKACQWSAKESDDSLKSFFQRLDTNKGCHTEEQVVEITQQTEKKLNTKMKDKIKRSK